jgi:2-keto-4-pentenoate hydratase/2-oxohepta-3-ene-1,7-dioic acid hydratase in catechol pathway
VCSSDLYVNHIKELKNERPEEPIFFLKPNTAILPKRNPFYIPEFSNDIHHEIELIVKICKVGKHIDVQFAHKYYEEISVGIDFTARDVQNQLKEKGLPWEKAKAFDNSAIIGDFVPKSEFNSLENITFELKNNGKRVQKSSSKYMIWKIDELISYISKFITLKTGDIIFTGTPEGVAKVAPNDVLEGFLEKKKLLSLTIK